MGVIRVEAGRAVVNEEECVECGTCKRFLRVEGFPAPLVRAVRAVLHTLHLAHEAPPDVCPAGALFQPELEWPRSVRKAFSDPTTKHASTGIGGRGTEEIKTNDVTGRLRNGDAGLIVEMGRPGLGARLAELDRVARAMAELGARFESKNPVTQMMPDPATGALNPEVLNEKVMSAIIEMKVPVAGLPEFLGRLNEVAAGLTSVCSVAVAGRCDPDGSIPYEEIVVKETGFPLSLTSKTNLGLGRPRFGESGVFPTPPDAMPKAPQAGSAAAIGGDAE